MIAMSNRYRNRYVKQLIETDIALKMVNEALFRLKYNMESIFETVKNNDSMIEDWKRRKGILTQT
jgi:hypothetical protein